jgi:type I restriction enzyme R subunit
VQDYRRYDPSAAAGIALREAPMKAGFADYLLIANRRPAGIIEAKKPRTCPTSSGLIRVLRGG